MKLKYNRKGFTLIELLVVVAIISLLTSIVFAGLRDARDKAQYSRVDQEFLQLRNAIALYRADNGGNYPSSVNITEYGTGTESDLISELYNSGHFPSSTINLPNGHSFFGGIYPAGSNTPGVGNIGEIITCGNPQESGNSYSIGIIVDSSKGANTSRMLPLYSNGELYSIAYVSSDYAYCFEF